MTTTIMRNSKVGDAWIRQCVAMNPIQPVIDPQTGQPNGNILTGPVRLAFVNLFTPSRGMANAQDQNKEPKYGTMILFPPPSTGVDMTHLYNAYYAVLGEKFRD
ncbi:hypothetical protein, partial [Tepidimonas sp.]|uniref:hypothetical protein n=1 Tax=Tepidimonas sp. TaxID=2002775 RepID=UPI00391BAFC7